MKKSLLTLMSCLFILGLSAQGKLDYSEFKFKRETRSFAVFAPEGFTQEEPKALVVALPPYNPERWNPVAWRDTLAAFAEANDLFLVCPDGGDDGKFGGKSDTAFASFLVDSMQHWYPIDPERIFLMGFSWGGRGTLTYGLNRPDLYAGYILIGTALSPEDDLAPVYANANDKPAFLIHGEMDSPDVRFYPVRDTLIESGAYVRSKLLKGTGHTIDFEGRNQSLTEAFNWIDSVRADLGSYDTSATATRAMDMAPVMKQEGLISVFPEKIRSGGRIECEYLMRKPGQLVYRITDVSGKILQTKSMSFGKGRHNFTITTRDIPWGVYIVIFESPDRRESRKFMIRG